MTNKIDASQLNQTDVAAEAEVGKIFAQYQQSTDDAAKLKLKSQLKKATGLDEDLEALLDESDTDLEEIMEAVKMKKDLVANFQKKFGLAGGAELFGIAELEGKLEEWTTKAQLKKDESVIPLEIPSPANEALPEITSKNKAEIAQPNSTEKNGTLADKLIGDLARLTASQVPAERKQAAEILSHLSREQTAAIRPKLTPELRKQFNDFEAKEFSPRAPQAEKKETKIDQLVGDLARLTASTVPVERKQAVEILSHLTPGEVAAMRPKMTPELRTQVNNFEVKEFSHPAPEKKPKAKLYQVNNTPGFGRQPVKKEKPDALLVQEREAIEKLVGKSNAKKSRRDYNPVDDIVKKLDKLTEYDDPKSDREAAEIIKHLLPEQTAQLPGKMSPELIRRLMSIEVPPPESAPAPEKGREKTSAKPRTKAVEYIRSKPAEKPVAPVGDTVARKSEAEKTTVKPEKKSWQPKEHHWSRAEILEVEAIKKQRHADELKKHLLKTGLGLVASVAGLKTFSDLPAYLKDQLGVKGNILGIGHGKGLGGSIEELMAESQKGHAKGRTQADEEGFANVEINWTKDLNQSPVIQAIRDLDKRLAMTREGSTKNSEQRQLIAKLLAENRHKEMLTREKRQQEIKIILDDYTTTKVTGVQLTRDVLDTACVAMTIPTYGAALKFRSLLYMPLSALDKANELKKKARVGARTRANNIDQKTGTVMGDKMREEMVARAEKRMGLLEMAKRSAKETFFNLLRKGEGTGWQKSMKQASAIGNILRFAGIAATSFITPGGYDKAVNQVLEALRHSETWSHAGKNFLEGAMNRLTFGAAFHDLATGKTAAELPSMTHSAGTAPQGATGSFEMTKNPSETNAAYNAEHLAEAPIGNNAHTVWVGLKDQLIAKYGKDFSDLPKDSQDESIRLLINRISADPEAYGLPKDLDYAKLSQEQIDQIPWDKVLAGEGEPTAAVHNLGKTLAEPGDNLKNFGGGTRELTNEESYNNAADFFENKRMSDRLADLSEKARRWHDASLPPAEKNRIIAEISEMRKTVERLTGGFLIYDDRSGDWNVQMPDNQIINVFHSHSPLAMNAAEIQENLPPGEASFNNLTADEASRLEIKIPPPGLEGHEAIAPTHPEAGLEQPAEPAAHEAAASNSDEDSFSKAIQDAEAKKVPEINLADTQNIKGDLADGEIARHLAERPGALTLNLQNVTSVTPAALEAMCGKTNGYIILTGLDAHKMNDDAYQALAHLKQSCTVGTNDAVEKGFAAWQNEHSSADLWAVDENHVPAPHEQAAALAENAPEIPTKAAADFAAQAHENPYGIFHEVKPDFADKYSPAQQENITAYLNAEIKERNELLNVLKEYQDKYGDRPEQLAAFRLLLENHVTEQNNNLEANLKGLTDPNQDFSHNFEKLSGDPLVMAHANAAHEAEKLAGKAGLILPGEQVGNSSDELADRVAAHGGPKVLTAADLHKIVGSHAEVREEHGEVKGSGGNYEVFTAAEMRGTGEENLNMEVVNKLHLTPMQMEALKTESDRLSALGAELEKHEPRSPEALAIIKVIKNTMEQGKKTFGTDAVFSRAVRQVAEVE